MSLTDFCHTTKDTDARFDQLVPSHPRNVLDGKVAMLALARWHQTCLTHVGMQYLIGLTFVGCGISTQRDISNGHASYRKRGKNKCTQRFAI
jgi:hypothetical protein